MLRSEGNNRSILNYPKVHFFPHFVISMKVQEEEASIISHNPIEATSYYIQPFLLLYTPFVSFVLLFLIFKTLSSPLQPCFSGCTLFYAFTLLTSW